ncbi:excalibur calcium-binding domain-containing protein [Paenibacillus sp. An7]|uniref:excalibur calcium-binding domain-containing protein n=1 Tax=Paenibacillus sp. An7 TaxID=2689577 RepID=UPI001F48E4A7|nr:excalibur calcium-binding domain-containing protein [Paenibacillus sp. An7]
MFMIGLFLIFTGSMSPYAGKWSEILYPTYLSGGLGLFSAFTIMDEHYFIGYVCLTATGLYLIYLVFDFKIGGRAGKDSPPEWLGSIGMYPVCFALISLFFLPSNYINFNHNSDVRAYYSNCTEARNQGAAPIYSGEPGYRAALDRDNDGVACE